MADYLLYPGSHRLHGSVVLELGAGTGLVSIIAALKAHHVFCTGNISLNFLYDKVVMFLTKILGVMC